MYKDLDEHKYSDDDVFAEYRDRIMYLFGIAAVVLGMPFSIGDLIEGKIVMGLTIFVMLTVIAINAFWIHRKKRHLIPPPVLIVAVMLVVGQAVYHRGENGFFWAYPGVLFIAFAVKPNFAKLYTMICLVYLSGLILYFVELKLALRGIVSLIITIIFTNIFLNIIYELRERLLKQSISDPLTGALNRRQLSFSLDAAIERKHRACESASLLAFDIDHFKNINDDCGHDVGDHVIREVVNIIASRTRKLDQLFRVGGEEFTLILPLATGFDAKRVAKELCAKIANAKLIDGRRVTVSVGVSELEPGADAAEWVKQADRALYEAKRSGRNRVVWWQQIADVEDDRRKKGRGFLEPKPIVGLMKADQRH